jgi:hypothetical protein
MPCASASIYISSWKSGEGEGNKATGGNAAKTKQNKTKTIQAPEEAVTPRRLHQPRKWHHKPRLERMRNGDLSIYAVSSVLLLSRA